MWVEKRKETQVPAELLPLKGERDSDPVCIAKALEVPLSLKSLYSSYLKACSLSDQ